MVFVRITGNLFRLFALKEAAEVHHLAYIPAENALLLETDDADLDLVEKVVWFFTRGGAPVEQLTPEQYRLEVAKPSAAFAFRCAPAHTRHCPGPRCVDPSACRPNTEKSEPVAA